MAQYINKSAVVAKIRGLLAFYLKEIELGLTEPKKKRGDNDKNTVH